VGTLRAQRVGTLDCLVKPGGGLIVETRELDCWFTSLKGEQEHYSGQIKLTGFVIGATVEAHQSLSVEAVADVLSPGAFEGIYNGQGGDFTFGAEIGGFVLCGGNDRKYWVKGISIGIRPGVHAAIGNATLALKLSPKER
jgi:hypothetical protein